MYRHVFLQLHLYMTKNLVSLNGVRVMGVMGIDIVQGNRALCINCSVQYVHIVYVVLSYINSSCVC